MLVWILLVYAPVARAQESAVEFWPEIDTWWRLTQAWRLSLFVPISKNLDTHYREGNFIPQVDYVWGQPRGMRTRRLVDEDRSRRMHPFMARGGYLAGKSLGDQGEQYTERAILGEFHLRIPLQGNLLLSHRVRTDLRWLGDDAEYTPMAIARHSAMGWNKATTVILLDDPEGNTWIMKGFQLGLKPQHTYEEFEAAAPSKLKALPKGWKVRVKTLERDLIEKPEGGVATITSDEFFNVHDKTGPGMTNYKP